MPLDPEYLAIEAQQGQRYAFPSDQAAILARAAAVRPIIDAWVVKEPEDVEKSEGRVGDVKIRFYKPKKVAAGLLPVIIYAHAGGLMIFDMDFEDPECVAIAGKTQSIIISVEYRLSPEHTWPAQLDDCFAVYQWAFRNATSFGGDPGRMMTGGGSAGGLLATALPRRIYCDPELQDSIRGVIALYPGTVHSDNVPAKYQAMHARYWDRSGPELEPPPYLSKESIATFWRVAALSPQDASAFAVLAIEETRKFPPTYLVSAEYDPLAADAAVLAQQLKDIDVPVRHDYYAGFFHFFHSMPLTISPTVKDNLVEGVKWLQRQM